MGKEKKMITLHIFHSGNPAWKSCHTAIGVAQSLKEEFNDRLDLRIFTNQAPEAKEFPIKSSTNVFVNRQAVSLGIALARDKMKIFLQEILN